MTQIEVFSHAKYRDGKREGDDIAIVIPGRFYGVFDGATDALGTRVGRHSIGRLAAKTVADVLLSFALDPARCDAPAETIIGAAADALRRVNEAAGVSIPGATTIAAVFEGRDAFRVLMLGDSAIRVNGSEVIASPKIIDDVSIAARIWVFKRLAEREADHNAVALAARRVILLGLNNAVAEGVLTTDERAAVLAHVIADHRFAGLETAIRDFLKAGIAKQYLHANAADSPLGFAAMDGSPVLMAGVIDRRLKRDEVQTLELFTDGYFGAPEGTTVAEWEELFAEIETVDFHKINRYPGSKGSTKTEFSDDRSIISLRFGQTQVV